MPDPNQPLDSESGTPGPPPDATSEPSNRQLALLEAFLRFGTTPCGVCGYDLHGLTEPRCPECGAAVYIAAAVRCVPISDGSNRVPPSIAFIRSTNAICPACGDKLARGNGHDCPTCGWVVDISVLRWASPQRLARQLDRKGSGWGCAFICMTLLVLAVPGLIAMLLMLGNSLGLW